MTHPRTLVREDLGRQLVQRGAWASAVFVDRAAPLEEDGPWPNVCIYTNSDRTLEILTNDVRQQELSVLVEVRAKRDPSALHQTPGIEGMPHHPADTGRATRALDNACETIERIVFERFNNTRLELEGMELDFDPITEINTDLTRSADGEVPHVLAQIEFKVIYKACFAPLGPETCPLEHFFGQIKHLACNEEDPANGRLPVPATVHRLQPELGNC
ncbi:MAG TPA: hypothetical protein VE934_12015 [Polaromonas sp.]|uniref:hypothetical protein n=1 Tax=Polaromonas sp. TaxID=1869339 RepID=UPI002D7063D1|nr:hypothetical protein [Polaromonas sp.]HYW57681.1 hypothetical protein [Polaromonas sp.]